MERSPVCCYERNGKDTFFVELNYIMDPLIAAADGLSLTFFGDEGIPYMTLAEAEAWLTRELRSVSDMVYQETIQRRLDGLHVCMGKIAAGKVIIREGIR